MIIHHGPCSFTVALPEAHPVKNLTAEQVADIYRHVLVWTHRADLGPTLSQQWLSVVQRQGRYLKKQSIAFCLFIKSLIVKAGVKLWSEVCRIFTKLYS